MLSWTFGGVLTLKAVFFDWSGVEEAGEAEDEDDEVEEEEADILLAIS